MVRKRQIHLEELVKFLATIGDQAFAWLAILCRFADVCRRLGPVFSMPHLEH